jgi:hypothetical protein
VSAVWIAGAVAAGSAAVSTSARALATQAHHKTTTQIARPPPLLDEANLPTRMFAVESRPGGRRRRRRRARWPYLRGKAVSERYPGRSRSCLRAVLADSICTAQRSCWVGRATGTMFLLRRGRSHPQPGQ